jgi:hypothetical protein
MSQRCCTLPCSRRHTIAASPTSATMRAKTLDWLIHRSLGGANGGNGRGAALRSDVLDRLFLGRLRSFMHGLVSTKSDTVYAPVSEVIHLKSVWPSVDKQAISHSLSRELGTRGHDVARNRLAELNLPIHRSPLLSHAYFTAIVAARRVWETGTLFQVLRHGGRCRASLDERHPWTRIPKAQAACRRLVATSGLALTILLVATKLGNSSACG